jgi:hypothetical protein
MLGAEATVPGSVSTGVHSLGWTQSSRAPLPRIGEERGVMRMK